jgi:hypothetical protein
VYHGAALKIPKLADSSDKPVQQSYDDVVFEQFIELLIDCPYFLVLFLLIWRLPSTVLLLAKQVLRFVACSNFQGYGGSAKSNNYFPIPQS